MSWQTFNLGELVEEFSFRPADLELDPDKLKFFGVSNTEGIIPTKNAAKDKAAKYKVIEQGCFAYNPYRINVGSVALLNKNTKGLISPAYVVFKPLIDKILPELLLMLLRSDEGLRQIDKYARGTVRKALRFDDLKKLTFSLPSLGMQKRIVKNIFKVNEFSNGLLIENEKRKKALEDFKYSTIDRFIKGKGLSDKRSEISASECLEQIRLEKLQLIEKKIIRKRKKQTEVDDSEKLFELPNTWEWCRLGDAADLIFDGPFGSKLKTEHYTSSGVRVIRLENLGAMEFKNEKKAFISLKRYEDLKNHEVFNGDLIIGSFMANGVNCTVMPEIETRAIVKADCFVIRVNQDFFCERYLMYLLNSKLIYKKLRLLLKGMTRLRINTSKLRSLVIPFPPFRIQKEISSRLDLVLLFNNELIENINQEEEIINKIKSEIFNDLLNLKRETSKEKGVVQNNQRENKYDPKTTLMKIVELLKKHGKTHAEDLWKMSKHPDNIDAFYAELKKEIEVEKRVKESEEKGYLELV